MDLIDLSEIFGDPAVEELTDHILNDINIHELDNCQLFSEDLFDDHDKYQKESRNQTEQHECTLSNGFGPQQTYNTLEALLKSATPLSRVPPAPELRSNNKSPIAGYGLNRESSQTLSQSIMPTPYPKSPIKAYCNQPVKSKIILERFDNCSTMNMDFLTSTDNSRTGQQYPMEDKQKSSQNLPSESCRPCGALFLADGNTKLSLAFKRAPHNAIEKRYRASINGRIDELRNILSPFRSSDEKLNKSAVLRQAIERINALELENQRLRAEVMTLRVTCRQDRVGETKPFNASPESGILSLERSPPLGIHSGCLLYQSNPHSGSDGGNGSLSSSPGTDNNLCPLQHIQSQTSATIGHLDTCANTFPWLPSSSGAKEAVLSSFTAYQPLPDVLEVEKEPPLPGRCAAADGVTSSNSLLTSCDCNSQIDNSSLHLTTLTNILMGNKESPVTPSCRPNNSIELNWDSHYLGSGDANTAPLSSTTSTDQHIKRNSTDSHDYGGPAPNKVRRQLIASSLIEDQHLFSSPRIDGYLISKANTGTKDKPSVRPLQVECPPVHNLLELDRSIPQDTGGRHSSANFNTGLAARTTLCVTALCLIVLDPVIFFGSSRVSRQPTLSNTVGGKSSFTSPGRRLLSAAVDGLDIPNASSFASIMVGFIQWTIAILLCLWACIKSQPTQVLSSQGDADSQRRQQAMSNAIKWHWSRADMAVQEKSWSVARQHLIYCLRELGFPLSRPAGTTALGWRQLRLLSTSYLCLFSSLLSLLFLHLPRWLYHFHGRYTLAVVTRRPATGSASAARVDDNMGLATRTHTDTHDQHAEWRPVEVSISDIQHRYMDLYLIAKYSGSSFHLSRLSAWKLLLASFRHILSESNSAFAVGSNCAQCRQESIKETSCCCHQNNIRDILVGRAATFALFVQGYMGNGLLSYVCLHVAFRIARCLPGSSFWHNCLLNPTVQECLRTGDYLDLVCKKPVVCNLTPRMYNSNLLAVLLPGLRRILSEKCFRVIFFGSDVAFHSIKPDITTLTSLCRVSPLQPIADQDSTLWWSDIVHALWKYRYALTRGNHAHSSHNGASSTLRVTDRGVDTVSSQYSLPALQAPSLPVSACPTTGKLAKALWMASRSLLKSTNNCELLSSAGTACHLLTESIETHVKATAMDRCYKDVGTSFAESTHPSLDNLAWHVVCADWTLTGLTRCLQKSHAEISICSRTRLAGTYLQALSGLFEISDVLQSTVGISLPSWILHSMSQYEAIGYLLRGANPVVTRLALLHNRRNRTGDDLLQLMSTKKSFVSYTTHYPISLSSSQVELSRKTHKPLLGLCISDEMARTVQLPAGKAYSRNQYSGSSEPGRLPRSWHQTIQSPGQ